MSNDVNKDSKMEKIKDSEINIPGTTSKIDVSKPVLLFWNPQPDITAFEVGVAMGIVMASAQKAMMMSDFPDAEGLSDIKRHFLFRQKNSILVPKGSSANLPRQ